MATEQIRDAQAIIEAVERYHGAKIERPVDVSGKSPAFAIVPNGVKVESIKKYLDEYLEVPDRKKGTTTITTLESFVAFVNRHKTEHSVVFLDDTDIKAPKLVAVFNPHRAMEQTGRPDWGDFRATYKFPLSPEWLAWTTIEPALSQAAFANFIEDHIVDVCPIDDLSVELKNFAEELGFTLASPARLLGLSRGLSVHVDAKVSQHLNLSTGEGQLLFAEEHKDSTGAPIKVPGAFGLSIPVFRHGERSQVPVRLRYRARVGDPVTWFLAPLWIDKVFEDALNDAQDTLASSCELPVFRGAP